jgi:hypothetical protein
MNEPHREETKRTSPLALWRYGHDYLRVARELAARHRLRSDESQVPYHAAAQGIEFALLAYLRARGAAMEALRSEVAHSLDHALAQSQAQGLPPLPPEWRPAVGAIAAAHRETSFAHVAATAAAFPDLDPLIDAGVWLLDCTAPEVAAHYVATLGDGDSPTVDEFVRRMRADLSVTAGAPDGEPAR